MKSIWRMVSSVVLALIILGAVAVGIGVFTGGSVERMIELVFGGREALGQMIELLKTELGLIFGLTIS